MAKEIKLRLRHALATAAEWVAADPVLLDGEIGIERDTGAEKLGDGITVWSQLPYRVALPDRIDFDGGDAWGASRPAFH